MSRIAKNSIKIDQDTSCKFENGNFFAKGKLGEMNFLVNPLYTVEIQNNEIFVKPIAEKISKTHSGEQLGLLSLIL